MNGRTACETQPAPVSGDIARLEESFEVFTKMTRDLEVAYDKLTRRASRIDVELRRTNAELGEKVTELQALTENRNSILDALPVGVVVIDAAGHIGYVNPSAERMLGRRGAELVGRSCEAVVGPTGDRLLAGGADGAEREVVALDGSRRRLSHVRESLPDGGELQVLSDRTVVARLREQVNRLDTLAALGEMAAGVAHEIRNPLNGIDGFASLLARTVDREDDSDPSLARYAENIRRGVREVNAIVSNLLTFAAPERLQPRSVEPVRVIEEVVREVSTFPDTTKAVELSHDASPEAAAVMLCADVVKLRIVFTNLVRNAIEAIESCGRVTVETELDDERGRLVTHVTDDGPGIAPELVSKLFQPFTTNKPEGTGLGLAIAHKLVALHGGELRHVPRSSGCRFTVSLPLEAEGAAE